MKILVTGKGGAGSWEIRGQQLGKAIGATVRAKASTRTMARYDLVVVVKRVSPSMLDRLRSSGTPWVWDIVDAWPQEQGRPLPRARAFFWLSSQLLRLKPAAVVFPTLAMANDSEQVGAPWRGPRLVLPHHARPQQLTNPIRQRLRVVGYEGSPRYLAGLGFEDNIPAFGLRFVINPKNLAEVDVLVAMRSPAWNGYAATHWKSNVKLANAHATGTPIILAIERGYIETQSGAERWAGDIPDLIDCLDELKRQDVRQEISREFIEASKATALPVIAAKYKAWLEGLL